MNVKNYRGKTADECFQQVKAEMGRDAVILQSRTVRPIFGKFGPKLHEVVAASDVNLVVDKFKSSTRPSQYEEKIDEPALPKVDEPALALARGRSNSLAAVAAEMERQNEDRQRVAPRPMMIGESDDRLSKIEKQIAMLTETVQNSAKLQAPPAESKVVAKSDQSGVGGFFRYKLPVEEIKQSPTVPIASTEPVKPTNYYTALTEKMRSASLADALIRKLLEEMPAGLGLADATSHLHDLLAQRFLVGQALDPIATKMQVAALLGPTGVGKTTTVAKLAAQLSLKDGVSVGMITLDTQRVAASQQLQSYGDILGIPVRVAFDKAELEKYLSEFSESNTQVVLIDTPGRSPSEALPLAEMSASLRSVVDLLSYLVVPATLSASNFENVVARFSKVAAPTAFILSKLDETVDTQCLGFLMNMQAKTSLPLAYVTTGSRVPDDILIPDAHLLINKMLG